ncbi:MAG: hypothetical protein CO189_08255 [candidate division Zixibacteria bacterium CG_4_9_14_3_um_filter_46_8]|nr:MAG: hypothetical protein CO189_08255 [candidate division Zixibacteria bacterium CG_4_9_14_3_um_filter_46_8]
MASKVFILSKGDAILPICCFLLISTILSCGPKLPKPITVTKEEPSEIIYAPSISGLRVTALNGETNLYWKTDRQDGQAFGGYDIYIVPSDMNLRATPQPRNQSRYPGDTDLDPESESFKAEGLEPGKIYKTWVVAYSSNTKSQSVSDTVLFCPMITGEITLSLLYSNEDSGYDFSKGRYVSARSAESDIMFFAGKGLPKLSAPERLDPKLQATRFRDIGAETAFNSFRTFSNEGFSGVQSLPLRKGNLYLIKTADNHFAKLECTDITGEGGRQRVRLRFMYNPVKQYTKFQ